ncbi:MAG: valine--tRNA ligase [Clostridiales bacterium]|nr:valine--tRNA ligase [Clostridiales bacterium]
MEPKYNPKEIEGKIYEYWQSEGCFVVAPSKDKKAFAISMPPPNVTGQLHMGHALDQTLQDVLIRAKRMQGYAALWLPGTDHAGIATQIKVEESLSEQGITRQDLGRDKFLDKVWEWKEQYGGRIMEQIKRLGASCDWSRLRFTMDEGYARAVRGVFVDLYEQGLIYRGNRIINWCPKCTTALSDTEVEHTEKNGSFWHIRYPLEGGGGYITVATTRPETMLGDTAVVVNPSDKRYKRLIGRNVIIPLVERKIPIIADEHADETVGTGAVKITPAHDPDDFEVGLRHKLEQICVMDERGVINEHGGKYRGMDRYEARKAIIQDLEAGDFLVETEPHVHNVGECYRCGTTVEPMVSKQWFVSMKPLAKEAMDVVKSGEIEFVPARFAKTYLNWMENVHDWCISRQLWWGHRIPAFYCDECDEVLVTREDITECPKCGAKVVQDEDVLDTWFSSALWPFATLGYPENTPDLDYFYPNDVLITGYDIIFFWVARMIFSGLHHTKKKPFSKVLIHGIVRDGAGQKMSKSLGNGIDPIDIIDEYGADALRVQLISGNAPGNDMRFYTSQTEAFRNFANKLWNASRFVLMNMEKTEAEGGGKLSGDKLELEDKWILTLVNALAREVNENIEKFELGIAFSKIYDFIWDEFCDWYIEMVKPRILQGETGVFAVLTDVLTSTIKLLHPFMPFITEEIYQNVCVGDGDKGKKGAYGGSSISVAEFPVYRADWDFSAEAERIEAAKTAIRAIRNMRAEMNVPPSKRAKVIVVTDEKDVFKRSFFEKLAYAESVEFGKSAPDEAERYAGITCPIAQIFVARDDLADKAKERERLVKERAFLLSEIEMFESKLSNVVFMKKAPPKVIEEQRTKLANCRNMLVKVEEQLLAAAMWGIEA